MQKYHQNTYMMQLPGELLHFANNINEYNKTLTDDSFHNL